MKKLLLSVLAVVAAAAVHAQDANDPVKPIKADDPVAPYHNYSPAMSSTPDKPLTSVWQLSQRKAIDEATADAVLAAFVKDAASAEALLAKLKGAYATDPLTLTQIASVSQWVMLPDAWYNFIWDGPHAAGRKVWVKALIGKAASSSDDYVRIFCLDQLRWCGRPCQAECIMKVADASSSKAVREMADTVVRHIYGRRN